MKQRALNLLVTLDQLLFCLLCLGNSYPDETASACVWRMELKGRLTGRLFRPLLDRLFWFDPEHCKTSFESERLRLQSAPEERSTM